MTHPLTAYVPQDFIAYSALLDRFWSNVAKGKRHACWPWTGASKTNGYPRVWVMLPKGPDKPKGDSGRFVRAHRMAYVLTNGVDPDGHVLHTCGTRTCCNPSHLTTGTLADVQTVRCHAPDTLDSRYAAHR